eukprot:1160118-Pelagomonas_calceolata.AAC.6
MTLVCQVTWPSYSSKAILSALQWAASALQRDLGQHVPPWHRLESTQIEGQSSVAGHLRFALSQLKPSIHGAHGAGFKCGPPTIAFKLGSWCSKTPQPGTHTPGNNHSTAGHSFMVYMELS